MTHLELKASDLIRPNLFHKKDKMTGSEAPVGQDLALKTLKLGVELSSPQTHFFCVGPKGVGRTSLTLQFLKNYAQKHFVQTDWVCVADFDHLDQPKTLSLPAGQGEVFVRQMAKQVSMLRQNLKNLFSQNAYLNKLQELDEAFHHKKENYLKELETYFISKGIALVQVGTGYGLCPVLNDEIYDSDSFNALDLKTRQRILPKLEKGKKELAEFLKKLLCFDDEKNNMVEELNKIFISHLFDKTFASVQKTFKNQPNVLKYLATARSFLLEHAMAFMDKEISEKFWSYFGGNPFLCVKEKTPLPVICPLQVDIPSLLGNAFNDTFKNTPLHMQLSAGYLHQANGGFLILDAHELLIQKDLFHVLKQSLFSHQIPFKNIQTIPLLLKVVLIGSRSVYEELKTKDEDFSELFKLIVPFEEQIERTEKNEKALVAELIHYSKENKLKSFSNSAYQILLNYASRLALNPQTNLSLHIGKVHELMRSADYFARLSRAHQVEGLHVQRAISEEKERGSFSQKQWLENIRSGLLKLELKGTQVGSIHTLSVCSTDEYRFGRVSRLTCATYAGNGQITDIEGQVNFGGPVHAKGILFLQSYLKMHYGQRESLKLDAALGFEQSYGPIEGDSASAAELCAVMSAIGFIPLSQSLALTGSVNMYGQIGAVAGINEKIEGFFDACQTLGAHSNQGVLLPKSCVLELLLKEEVVQAIKNKKFHLYPVETIEECMEILSGLNKKAIDEKISTAWHHAFLNAKK